MIRYLLICCCLIIGTTAFAQTSLGGKVIDDTGEAVLFGNIALYKNGVLVSGGTTDIDGNYSLGNLDPGNYDVEFSYTGLQSQKIQGVVIYAGKANKLDATMTSGVILDEVVVVDYKVPLIEQDNTTQGGTVTSEQIRQLPTRNINAIASVTAGASSTDEGDDISIRGSRSNSTDYYIDGVRVSGALIPESEIEQLQVITGGLEAKYGDVTGGIISITTKGPSQKFSGGIEAETSKGLDTFDNNILGLNLSGPIIKNKNTGQSILGYRVSGRYTYRGDDDPTAIPVFRVKDEKLAELEANPITNINGTRSIAADQLTDEDVEALDARPFETFKSVSLTAKLEARLSKTIDVAFTGTYTGSEDQFTPSRGINGTSIDNWRLLNAHHNPFDNNETYRGIFRFRQRLGAGAEETNSSALIRNLTYTLQFGYQKRLRDLKDTRHGDNLFDYGYVGDFGYSWEPAYDFSLEQGTLIPGQERRYGHVDYTRNFTGLTPAGAGHPNAGLAASNGLSDVSNANDFVVENGLFGYVDGPFDDVWGIHSNVNAIYNTNFKSDADIYTFNANSSFDFLPGGSDKGRHTIEFGVNFEQRVNRQYTINPRRLWDLARLQANRHILGVDTSLVIGSEMVSVPGVGILPVDIYGTQIATDGFDDNQFFKKVREVTGNALNEYVNVDGLSPDQLSLGLFSPFELHSTNNIIDYQGYDYLGNRLTTDVTFEDFFKARDENGVRTYPVATDRPVYASAYIQDKFSFDDIIFRVGVRVDRYDANRKVLKDPYSLYEIMGARDFYASIGEEKPAGVRDDYKVYLENAGSDLVKAFRDGDDWYFANGNPANDGNVIFGGGVINPKLADEDADIQSADFNPDNSFEDYEPQISVMPRLAVSFPISDEANFFAHYDVLVQRPQVRTNATALDYLYFLDPRRTPSNNPNLKPEKTIDYEVGFQQKISNSSALKIATYYRELRDMIQTRTYLFVPVLGQYNTFDNQDFGTVKGFSFTYDLRRTNNIQLQANYTLQFADGTGSDALSQSNLTENGNLRTLFPLNFDERHRLNALIDYRFGKGSRYNGPMIADKAIFADAGLNLQVTAVSGRPYTSKTTPRQFGGDGTIGAINGARLPWNFAMNLRADKNFELPSFRADKPVFLNVYVRIQNLLDARNILDVYPATGSPVDDGYLASSDGVARVRNLAASERNTEAFLAAYSWALANPDFYTLPRRIFVGAIIEF